MTTNLVAIAVGGAVTMASLLGISAMNGHLGAYLHTLTRMLTAAGILG